MQVRLRADLGHIGDVCALIAALVADKSHIIILLCGDIGSGKTTLVAEFVRFRGINECATSPTFSLMHEYGGNIFHYDLYNRELSDALNLGILDLLAKSGIHFVEWGDMGIYGVLKKAFDNVEVINIAKDGDSRVYELAEECRG